MTSENFTHVTRPIIHSSSSVGDMNNQLTGLSEEGEHITILDQVFYQRFRYDIEKRTGKKQRGYNLLKLKVQNIPGGSVMKIFCIDALNDGFAHPNALVGKNCQYGIYTHEEFKTEIKSKILSIPYLQIRRVKNTLLDKELESRLPHLPSSFNEAAGPQRKFDTKKVRLCICITVPQEQQHIIHLSRIIRNKGEGAKLQIEDVSHISCYPKGTNEPIFILTREDAPEIEPGDYEVYLEERSSNGKCAWKSEVFVPQKMDIRYKHVIKFPVPAYKDVCIESDVEVVLVLKCKSTKEMDEVQFLYKPDPDLGVINRKRKKTGFSNSVEEYEPAEKSICISLLPSPQEDVKTKLKVKLARKDSARNDGTDLGEEESAPEDLSTGVPSCPEHKADQPSVQPDAAPREEVDIHQQEVTGPREGITLTGPSEGITLRVPEAGPNLLSPQWAGNGEPSGVVSQGCPNTFLSNIRQRCPADSHASVGSGTESKESDIASVVDMVSQNSTLAEEDQETMSIPSLDFGSLNSIDLITACSGLTSAINNTQINTDPFDSYLHDNFTVNHLQNP